MWRSVPALVTKRIAEKCGLLGANGLAELGAWGEPEVHFFGLLHLEPGQKSAVNVLAKDFAEQTRLYVRNAKLLSQSLKRTGFGFTLLTNDKASVEAADPGISSSLTIEEIAFSSPVPKGILFYSAHFKLDAFRYLSSLAADYVALCDLDMVCINEVPPALTNAIEKKMPLAYDISDQVIPAYGAERVHDDLEAMVVGKSEGRWMGGEFISGTPEFFGQLVEEISTTFPAYLNIIDRVHHVGDEAYTSAAIERLKNRGMRIGDAGTVAVVGRYWNVRPLHPQRPFDYFQQCFLLHLPADKRWLAEFGASRASFDPQVFLAEYRKELRSTLRNRIRKLGRNFQRFLRRRKELPPA